MDFVFAYFSSHMKTTTREKPQKALTPLKAAQLSRDGVFNRLRDDIDDFIRKAALGNSARKPATSVSIPIKTIRCDEDHAALVVEHMLANGWNAEVKIEMVDDATAPGGKRAVPTHIFVDWSDAKPRR